MQITKINDIITIDNVDFKQSKSWQRFYISKLGSYVTFTSRGVSNVRTGSDNYNAKGYKLQQQVCVERKNNKSVVINLGRLVLDAWDVQQTYDDEGVLRTEVDHINRDPFDNRLENLRWATRKENNANRRKNNPTWLNNPEVIAKRTETRRLNGFNNPTWLHTPEVITRRRKINPIWLKNPEVIAKRKETCRLKRLAKLESQAV